MKITGASAPSVTLTAQGPVAAPAEAPAPSEAPLQSEVLQPAREALASLPEFDAARVAELRDALARGELPFDPARLAGLIQRFHGSGR
ncbi:MAG: flagellar biosynthesis anti-sigma factor FlgM [Massilia sp.]